MIIHGSGEDKASCEEARKRSLRELTQLWSDEYALVHARGELVQSDPPRKRR